MIRGIWCWSSTPPSRHQTEWDQWRHKGQRKGPTVQTPQTFSLSPGPKRKERSVPPNCTLHPKEEGKGETHRGRSAGSRRRTQHTVTQPRTQTLREPLQPCPGPPAAAREAQSAASLSRVLVWQMGVQWGWHLGTWNIISLEGSEALHPHSWRGVGGNVWLWRWNSQPTPALGSSRVLSSMCVRVHFWKG